MHVGWFHVWLCVCMCLVLVFLFRFLPFCTVWFSSTFCACTLPKPLLTSFWNLNPKNKRTHKISLCVISYVHSHDAAPEHWNILKTRETAHSKKKKKKTGKKRTNEQLNLVEISWKYLRHTEIINISSCTIFAWAFLWQCQTHYALSQVLHK